MQPRNPRAERARTEYDDARRRGSYGSSGSASSDDARRRFDEQARADQARDRAYFERARTWNQFRRPEPAGGSATRKLDAARHYRALGLPSTAGTPDIKKTYRDLARRHHPDKHRRPDSVRKASATMQALNSAYQALKDGPNRRQYRADVLAGRSD